jgi:hypothetical protein
VGQEAAGIADDDRGYPDFRDEIGGEKAGEGHSVDLVSFNAAGGNEFDKTGIGDDDFGDEGSDLVVEIPGIGGRFDDKDVG